MPVIDMPPQKLVAKYDDLFFGMALTRMADVPVFPMDFMDARGVNAIEIPYADFIHCDTEFIRRYRRQHYGHVICGSLLDKGLSARIPFESFEMQRQYVDEFCCHICNLKDWNVSSVILDFDMGAILWDKDGRANALEMIKKIVPTVYSFGMELLLTCRLPNPDGFDDISIEFCRFLRDTMSPVVKAAVEIDCVSLRPDEAVGRLLGPLVWEMRQLVLAYDSDSGYRVSIDEFRWWLDFTRKYNFSGPFMIAPGSNENRMAVAEFDSFCNMVIQLRNE